MAIPLIGAALIGALNTALHVAGINYTISFAAVASPAGILGGIMTTVGFTLPVGVAITSAQAANALYQLPGQLASQGNTQIAIRAALKIAGVNVP